MLESIMQVVVPIMAFLQDKWGGLGVAMGFIVLFGIPLVSVLIELAEFVVSLTETKKDDEAVSKIRATWNKILPFLEAMPHANVPLSATMLKILEYSKKALAAVKGAVSGWLGKTG